MLPTLIAWFLAGILAWSSAREAARCWGWRRWSTEPDRSSQAADLLDVVCTAAFFRLAINWETASMVLWLLSAVALAAAAGGLVWRWGEMRRDDRPGTRRIVIRLVVLAALVGVNWFAG
ncbi:hypothetical protein [Arthrobacter castelli]|uniref:hypothetical protein n=1 Tax=Arthrobacter castelli TaxID=271431 RepID=UPI0003F86118|nr:hypothetical protein [Arthrobacter castelli]